MESLPEKNENRGDEHDRSRPNRQPDYWFLAVRGIHQAYEGQHISDNPDTGFQARFHPLTVVFACGQLHLMAAIHASTDVGVHLWQLVLGVHHQAAI
jgi:hypothetical protein